MAMVAANTLPLSPRTDRAYAYALMFLAVALLYILSMNFSYRYHQARVPRGDPFTYTLSLYNVLELSRASFWGELKMTVTSENWYWLQNLLVAILSPIIVK